MYNADHALIRQLYRRQVVDLCLTAATAEQNHIRQQVLQKLRPAAVWEYASRAEAKIAVFEKLFGNISEESKQKFAFWKKIPERGRHPAIGTLGIILSLIGLVLFCSKPPLGMTILSLGALVLVNAAITGNLKLFR